MNTTILQHNISYHWNDDGYEDLELCETDIEHIEEQIKEGYNQGELCQVVNQETEVRGWWKIVKE